MPTVQVRTTDNYAAISPDVFHRANWQDSWTKIENVVVQRVTPTSGAAIGESTFVFEYGSIIPQDHSTPQDVEPLDIADHFIKISFTPHAGPNDLPGNTPPDPILPVNWYGIARDEVRSEHSSTSNLSGTQTWTAVGLEWILTRSQYTSSVFDDSPGTLTIPYGTAFNAQRGDKYGNRSGALFDLSSVDDDSWNARQIIEYLLANHAPGNANSPDWDLIGQSSSLEGIIPNEFDVHGQTVFDIINLLVTSRRGLMWRINVIEDIATRANERWQVDIRTLAGTNLALPGGSTLFANTVQWDVDLQTEIAVRSITRVETTQQRYSSVSIEGAQRGTVFTALLSELRDWTAAQVTSYKAAPNGGATTVTQQRANRDAVRYTNPDMRPCWTRYAMPFDFDNQSLGWFPDYDWNGDRDTVNASKKNLAGMRFQEFTPMVEGIDYENPNSPVDNRDSNSVPKLVRSSVVFQDPKDSSRWIDSDSIGTQSTNEGESDAGVSFRLDLRFRTDRAGFNIYPSDAPHQIGFVDDVALDPDHAFNSASDLLTTDHIPQLKWDNALATVYATTDERARVEYPDPAGRTTVYNHEPQLVIQIGDRARQDFMPENTVVRIDNDGSLVRSTAVGYIRNDAPMMRDLAVIAYSWYSVKRVAINLQLSQITDQLRVGDYVNSITGSGNVNSVVSTVSWDFESNSTTITTQFGELDIEGLI